MSTKAFSVPKADLITIERPGLNGVIFDSLILAKRSLMRVPRQPEWLFGATVQPIMFLLLFRYIFGGALIIAGGSQVNYIIVGVIVQGVVFGSFSTSIGLATDVKEGLVDRFRSLPMSRISVLLGRILADMTLNIFVTTFTFVVALLIGFRPNGNPGEWLLSIGMILLLSFALAWIGAFIGLALKSIEAVNTIGFVWVFPVTFASTTFTEAATMPGWLQPWVKHQPFSLAVNSVRGWLTGYPEVGNDPLIAAAWLVLVCLIFAPLAIWAYEKRAAH